MWLFTVPQNHCVLIERFGKFRKVKYEGLHVRLPFDRFHDVRETWDGVANKEGKYVELTEQQTKTTDKPAIEGAPSEESRVCQTKDSATIEATATVYWRIKEPVTAVYEVDKLPSTISDMALNALRGAVGELELDKVFSQRDWINTKIREDLSKYTDTWGTEILRVEVRELKTKEDTRKALDEQAAAERQRQADILRAKGHAEALKNLALAETEYLKSLKQEIPAEDAAKMLIAQKFITGFDSISNNKSDKVFLPNSFQGLFSLDSGMNNVNFRPRGSSETKEIEKTE